MKAPADAPTVAYPFKNGIYLNVTNRCPTACRFCIKRLLKWRFERWNFRLSGGEPSVARILEACAAAADGRRFSEIVFCGYGESTYRLPDLPEICAALRRRHPGARLRLNTVGLGSLIWGRDITAELAGLIDSVAVSLNTADGAQWARLLAPLPPFRQKGFAAAQDFVRGCAAAGLQTTVTAVRLPGVDMPAVRRLAASLGAAFRPRPVL
ncbi:MAG: TatD family nuclease-associated radical SAM protein [Elusimicrobia bacterium]|nr:TatD family nuclease-associated radical SAM protein [Elusimicrobiota bacterium]